MPFAALALVALAVSAMCGSALRPEAAKSEGIADADLRATSLVEDLRSAVSSGAAASVSALGQTMTNITSPDYMGWTQDQKEVLRSVITIILTMNDELNVSQNSDQETVDGCIASLQEMNTELAGRLSDDGSTGKMKALAVESKADLAAKVSSHEEKLKERNLRESHISSVCAPEAGADQQSWDGFAITYSSKKDALQQWHDSFKEERAAHALLGTGQVQRDTHLCDWFGTMTTECASFKASFQGRIEACNDNAFAAKNHTELRNEACKLGKQLSAKVKELLGEADPSSLFQSPGKEEECFKLVLPATPARAECEPSAVMDEYEFEGDGWTSSQCPTLAPTLAPNIEDTAGGAESSDDDEDQAGVTTPAPFLAQGRWFLGENQQTCDVVCSNIGSTCDQSSLNAVQSDEETTRKAWLDAFSKAWDSMEAEMGSKFLGRADHCFMEDDHAGRDWSPRIALGHTGPAFQYYDCLVGTSSNPKCSANTQGGDRRLCPCM